MPNRFFSAPQETEKYVVNAAVLRTQVSDWYVVSDDMKGIQINGAALPDMLSFLASPPLVSRSEQAGLLTLSSDWSRFQDLVKQWHKERGATSSITEMVMCQSHLQIIAMGPSAIPLILRQMENEGDEPDMWFVALQLLTSADPVTDDVRGNFKKMAEVWLAWALRHGYVW
jgi:hypothetical protein